MSSAGLPPSSIMTAADFVARCICGQWPMSSYFRRVNVCPSVFSPLRHCPINLAFFQFLFFARPWRLPCLRRSVRTHNFDLVAGSLPHCQNQCCVYCPIFLLWVGRARCWGQPWRGSWGLWETRVLTKSFDVLRKTGYVITHSVRQKWPLTISLKFHAIPLCTLKHHQRQHRCVMHYPHDNIGLVIATNHFSALPWLCFFFMCSERCFFQFELPTVSQQAYLLQSKKQDPLSS